MSEEKVSTLKRQNAGKGPMLMDMMHEEESGSHSEEDLDGPEDLGEFFDRLGTAHEERVKVCRAYANYLVSFLPKKPKRVKKEQLSEKE